MSPTWEREGVQLYLADCREVLPHVRADAVVTDPPYGVGKAEWDAEFPTDWYRVVREIAETTYVMVGSSTIPKCLEMVGDDYRDVMSVWLSNGMTRGPLGFGNWIPVVVAQKQRRFLGGQNAFRVVVNTAEKINHPSPKPLAAMLRLIENRDHETILDPFMGSGTSGVACVRTGRRFIGIEIEPKYFEIAKKRIKAEQDAMPMIKELEAKEKQMEFAC